MSCQSFWVITQAMFWFFFFFRNSCISFLCHLFWSSQDFRHSFVLLCLYFNACDLAHAWHPATGVFFKKYFFIGATKKEKKKRQKGWFQLFYSGCHYMLSDQICADRTPVSFYAQEEGERKGTKKKSILIPTGEDGQCGRSPPISNGFVVILGLEEI